MGNVVLGAVIALVAVLIGYAITQRNAPDDGFKLLLEEIKKLQPAAVVNGETYTSLRSLYCLHCPYKTISSNDLELLGLEMDHHISTVHKEEDRDGTGTADIHP